MKSRVLSFEPEIESIIKKCQYCNLAMIDLEGKPYVVPMNFGYKDQVMYFHSGPEGKRLDCLLEKPEVCIALSTDHALRWQSSDVACSYSMKYRSVLIHGKAVFITETDEKIDALNVIMDQYTDEEYHYSEPAIKNVSVFKVVVKKIEGRAYGY